MLKIFSYLFLLFMIYVPVAAKTAALEEEFIFTKPPFASCHASTMTETLEGALLCAWFGGSEEGASDVAIWSSVFVQGQWSKPQKLAEEKGVACWNPVLFTMPSGKILLFYKVGKNPQQWSGMVKYSYDDGNSWTKAQELPAGVIGPAKNRPLLLENGTLLCGSSIESWRRWGCFMDITSDMGNSWKKSTPIHLESQCFGIIQPALFHTKQAIIKMLARSHQMGFICSAESYDQGQTWSHAKPINLPNPNSAIDAINLSDGRIVLVYNHSKEDRYPLNVAISKDDGDTWEMQYTVESETGEYSYPCVVQTRDGKIHITYTWNRTNIKHVVLDPDLL